MVASFITVHSYETQKLSRQLDNQLNHRIQTLSQSLASIETLLYSTRSYLTNSGAISPRSFEAFFTDLNNGQSIAYPIMWAPVIPIAELGKFEQQARKQGFLGYMVYPRVTDKEESAWFLNESVLPIFHISSTFEGADYLGLRLDSDQEIVTAMSRAISSDRFGVVSYISEGQQATKLLLPKFSNGGELQGFIVTDIVLHELLGEIWQQEVNSLHSNISVHIEPDSRLIFASHLNTELENDGLLTRIVSANRTVRVPLFNAEWTLSVSMLDRSGSTLMYGFASSFLILLLTLSATLAANFYATRLKVSDQVIEEKTRSLAIQAIKDNLTQLRNRTALSNEVDKQLKRLAQGSSRGFSILFIDLDRFKVINDSMGHLHGDKLLQQVAKRLVKHCRNHDMSFRFGGDEFVICLPELTSTSALTHICQRYSSVLSQPYIIEGQACHVGASIGISVVTDPSQTLASILREADTAMYKAKSSTHDKVVFFHDQMFNQAKKRFQLEQELTNALDLKHLSLVYQPIYATESNRVVGFESLLRWNHPTLGAISPQDFIPIAEETGLIIKIGDWVAHECFKTLVRLQQLYPENSVPRININVSAKQFESEHIYHTLAHLLEDCSVPAHLIGIEITESMLLADECSAHQLQRIKDLGVALYLDDFGTGYSSLSVLNDYPVDVIKVDRSFVSRIAMGQSNADSLCQAIINMAHIIDLEVVAEGVETQEQLAVLSQHKCNYIQGYLKSKPLSSCCLEDVLVQQSKLTA